MGEREGEIGRDCACCGETGNLCNSWSKQRSLRELEEPAFCT